MRYNFEWDPIKAKKNLRKHGIGFERAAELFLDPLAVSVFLGGHFKTGQRTSTLDDLVLPYHPAVWQLHSSAPMPVL